MSVTVTPRTFSVVRFDAPTIEARAERLLTLLDMEDHEVVVEVDESSPMARVRMELGPPIVAHVASGAFEDTRRPRSMSEVAVDTALGRALLRVRDRLSGRFDDAPPDAALSPAQRAAWDAYAVGRLERLGYPVHRPRWAYSFRNRLGFSDEVDQRFARLWSANDLSWSDLAALAAVGTSSGDPGRAPA
jgi:hypothetical protein